MSELLRTLLDLARRLTRSGEYTPLPSRLGDGRGGRVRVPFGEVARAALAGARAAARGRPVPRGPLPDEPQPVTSDCHCPTWRQLGDALAAASLAAGQAPNGRPVAAALGALAGVADLIARSQPHDPNA